jgi:hypothetical protein
MKKWGEEVQLHAFLVLALDVGAWSASRPAALIEVKSPRKGGPHSRPARDGVEIDITVLPETEPRSSSP